MRRRVILVVATCLALLAGIMPLVAMSVLSHERAIEAERAHMEEYAGWTLMRSSRALQQADAALQAIRREGFDDCSPAHLARMRQLTVDTLAIEEIGFFRNGLLACTSWGLVDGKVERSITDARLPGGLGLDFGISPTVSKGGEMLAVSRGPYNALVKPGRLVDVLSNTKMTLGVATTGGRLIATSDAVDDALVGRLIARPANGLDERHVFASIHSDGLVAFAVTDRASVMARLDRERAMLVPVGLVVSAILIGVVVWVSRQRLSPKRELEIAIRRNEFVVHYQPIIDLSSGLCVGAEALLRWCRANGDWIQPDIFIPMAEQAGLVAALTDVVIDQVTGDLAGLFAAEPSMHISINISADDVQSGRFLPVLAAALRRSGVAAPRVWLEATERGFVDADAARRTLTQARAAGHLVAIDDFGTGYSSLSMLEALPLDTLKIDKSFIDAIGKDAATSVVTPHIIEMAHGLDYKIVAEGVETQEQEAYVRNAGVHLAQGWLYSRALPRDGFAAYYRDRNGGRVSPLFRDAA